MYRILIIEDDRTIANVLAEHLRTWDYEVHCVTNFKNVMEDFREYEPQLVLLDIVLPLFNGFHWCQEIRKISKVPIIFLSSANDNMNIVMAMNMGGDEFVEPPALRQRSADRREKYPLEYARERRLRTDQHAARCGGDALPRSGCGRDILFRLLDLRTADVYCRLLRDAASADHGCRGALQLCGVPALSLSQLPCGRCALSVLRSDMHRGRDGAKRPASHGALQGTGRLRGLL